MATLYNIRGDSLKINELLREFLDSDDAEFSDEQNESLRRIIEIKEENQEDESRKLESMIWLIKYWEAWAKVRREEAKRITALAVADENRIKRLKGLIKDHLQELEITTLRLNAHNIGIRSAGGKRKLVIRDGVTPLDPEIPEQFRLISVDFNNDAIRKFLASGTLDYAYLEPQGNYLSIT